MKIEDMTYRPDPMPEHADWVKDILISFNNDELQLHCGENVFCYSIKSADDKKINKILEHTLNFDCEHEWIENEQKVNGLKQFQR